MLTDKQLLTRLEKLRDKCLEPRHCYGDDTPDGCADYSNRQSKALNKIMDAIDALHPSAKKAGR